MTAKVIDGKRIARDIERDVSDRLDSLARRGVHPGLAVIRVGDDAASEIYVRSKERKARELGLNAVQLHFPATITDRELTVEIDRLNRDESIDGVLLQLPLPSHLGERRHLAEIDPSKDVDGFHPVNVGNLHLGQPFLVPCTPAGIIRLVESTGVSIQGSRAIVVGRSNVVGKPVASLLLHRHATVTICHSRTVDLADVIRDGDIVVAAVGRPFMISGGMLRPGVVVIDVGINRIVRESAEAARLAPDQRARLDATGSVVVGDVDFSSASEVASWITPVPGGVGPMTIAMLMSNTVRAAEERHG